MRGQQEFLYIYLPDVLNRWYEMKIGIRAENFCFNIASGVHLWRQHWSQTTGQQFVPRLKIVLLNFVHISTATFNTPRII